MGTTFAPTFSPWRLETVPAIANEDPDRMARPFAIALAALAAALFLSGPVPSRSDETAALSGPRGQLIAAALEQINVTLIYDPSYRRLAYPNGDIPRMSGVCTDVIIRAYRDALGIDLQKRVHEDMRSAFSRYPTTWGLKGPDRNIDHRRVPNLRVFFARHGQSLAVSDDPADYAPGDIVTQTVGGGRPHIGIVTHLKSADGKRPLIVHNIGWGTRLEDVLFDFPITGHYRFGLGEA